MKRFVILLLMVITLCGCSKAKTRNKSEDVDQTTETPAMNVTDEVPAKNKTDVTPTKSVTDETPTKIVTAETPMEIETIESSTNTVPTKIPADIPGLVNDETSDEISYRVPPYEPDKMEEMSEFWESLKYSDISKLDAVSDRDKVEQIWSWFEPKWYSGELIQDIKDKKVLSGIKHMTTLEFLTKNLMVDGKETNAFVIQETKDSVTTGYMITSLEMIEFPNEYNLYGRPIDKKGKVTSKKAVLCYRVDMWTSTIYDPNWTSRYNPITIDFNEYINNTVLAGDYTDQDGKKYNFEQGMTATWDGKKIHYELSDEVTQGIECNLMYILDEKGNRQKEVYAYRFEDFQLFLYEAENKDGNWICGNNIGVLQENGLIYMDKTGETWTNMQKLAQVYNSLKDSGMRYAGGIYSDEFRGLWQFIYARWTSKQLVDTKKDQKDLSDIDCISGASFFSDEYPYYVDLESEYGIEFDDGKDNSRLNIEEFVIKDEDKLLYICGDTLYPRSDDTIVRKLLCILDIENGVLYTPDYKHAFVYDGTEQVDDSEEDIHEEASEPDGNIVKLSGICESLKQNGTLWIDNIHDNKKYNEINSFMNMKWHVIEHYSMFDDNPGDEDPKNYKLEMHTTKVSIDHKDVEMLVIHEEDHEEKSDYFINIYGIDEYNHSLHMYGSRSKEGWSGLIANYDSCYTLDLDTGVISTVYGNHYGSGNNKEQ